MSLELWRLGASPVRIPDVSSIARAVETALRNERFTPSGAFCLIFTPRRLVQDLNAKNLAFVQDKLGRWHSWGNLTRNGSRRVSSIAPGASVLKSPTRT